MLKRPPDPSRLDTITEYMSSVGKCLIPPKPPQSQSKGSVSLLGKMFSKKCIFVVVMKTGYHIHGRNVNE